MTFRPSLQAVTESSALVLQEERDEKSRLAYTMRQDGKSWYTIAKVLGVSESTIKTSVSRAMEEAAAMISTESKRQLLALEVDRLDRLQETVWMDAMRGDLQAVRTAIQVILARAKVLGLDAIPDTSITNNTLVVTGSSEEYVAALRAIAGDHG